MDRHRHLGYELAVKNQNAVQLQLIQALPDQTSNVGWKALLTQHGVAVEAAPSLMSVMPPCPIDRPLQSLAILVYGEGKRRIAMELIPQWLPEASWYISALHVPSASLSNGYGSPYPSIKPEC